MEEVVARGVQVLIALAGAYLAALWFVLVVWTYRDIENRSKSVLTQIFSTVLVVLFYVPGVLLYMILRPKETLDSAFQKSLEEEYLLQDLEELPVCQTCQRYVEDDFVLCPHCHTKLRDECVSCGRLVHLSWSLCPYCGAEQSEQAAAARERVELPAPRWRAPSLPRRRSSTTVVQRPSTPASLPDPVLQPLPQPVPFISASSEISQTREVEQPALSVVPDNDAAPVRLFDRKKTKANLRNNGGSQKFSSSDSDTAVFRDPVAINGSNGHTNQNSDDPDNETDETKTRKPRQMVRSRSSNDDV